MPHLTLVFGFCGLALAQAVLVGVFDPKTDCDKMPALIRDAAIDAGIDLNRVCCISDRSKFAQKAGERYARDLDRVGEMVRVVVPFGHLLLINGTELAVQMATRAYDSENKKRTNAARFTEGAYFRGGAELADQSLDAIHALKRAYAKEFAPYRTHGR